MSMVTVLRDGQLISVPAEAVHPPLTLEQAKAAKIADAKARRDAVELTSPFAWTHAGVTYTLDGNERSIARMLKVRDLLTEMAAQGVPADQAVQPWRTADDTYTPPLGPADITSMVYAKGIQGAAAWARFREVEAQVLAATTVQAVAAVDITTGWPA